MLKIKNILAALLAAAALPLSAQTKQTEKTEDYPRNWHMLSFSRSGFHGAGIEEAYELMERRAPKRRVVVAVIDGGIDVNHEDLKDNLWVNKLEIPDNGIDDDRNGYVDDVHGWNFLGAADGTPINTLSLEADRMFLRMKERFGDADSTKVSRRELEEFRFYRDVVIPGSPIAQAEKSMDVMQRLVAAGEGFDREMRARYPDRELTKDHYLSLLDKDEKDKWRVESHFYYLLGWSATPGATWDQIFEVRHKMMPLVRENYGKALSAGSDDRALAGDDPRDVNDRYYGNPCLMGANAAHGGHVAGIIGATRGNGIGVDGIADAELMILRITAGKGDEYDKDVANAIRYAVENGANIINMSFGKSLSPDKGWVDDAMRFAEKKGVLLVHAAGNSHKSLDEEPLFPSRDISRKRRLSNFITVGSIAPDGHPAVSSNYGKEVDLFAPGVDIYSTTIDNSYETRSGTSMAAPVVSGVAALIWSYFPELSVQELIRALTGGAHDRSGELVMKPKARQLIGERKIVEFGSLCASGDILCAPGAVRVAEEIVNGK